MTDIVEKLRQNVQWWHHDCEVRMKAATEIERLRNQKKELLDMVLENLGNEYPDYKRKYERLNRQYKSEREYLMEKFGD